jgi:hypothetical protein
VSNDLRFLLDRVLSWSKADQEKLTEFALALEGHRARVRQADDEELRAIYEGLTATRRVEPAAEAQNGQVDARRRPT